MGKKNDREISPVFETLAILDGRRKAPGTNLTTPPEGSVSEAKHWVDYNEK
ncbi:MAG: DUF3787 domain-containing protein [Firmicutes bacterium]|nr:DUF3787 domain-containing protein [Bacillota bacterium]